MTRKLERSAQRLDHLAGRLQAQRPQARLARAHERAHALDRRLQAILRNGIALRTLETARLRARLAAQDPKLQLARRRERAETLNDRLRAAVARAAERRALRLGQLARTLNAVSPLATLDRGYAILFDRASGRVVRSIGEVTADSALRARVADGEIDLRVDPE
jgi:exodeoxyribonuclease VII large subunit